MQKQPTHCASCVGRGLSQSQIALYQFIAKESDIDTEIVIWSKVKLQGLLRLEELLHNARRSCNLGITPPQHLLLARLHLLCCRRGAHVVQLSTNPATATSVA